MAESSTGNGSTSKGQGRGISYPTIGLEDAVAKARKFYDAERKASAPVVSAMKHFGYAETSGLGRQMVSALLQFGLLLDEGSKDKRVVRLSDRALTILLDEPHSPAKLSALRDAIRTPKIYVEMLSKWPDGLPSDHTISFFLQKDKDFNPKTLTSFIADFRSSLAYAKLLGADTITPVKPADPTAKGGDELPKVKVGDFVQWESNGALQLPEPRQVTGFSDDNEYVFVSSSATGIPTHEVTVMQAPNPSPGGTPPANPGYTPTIKPVAQGSRQDVFSLDEGTVVLQWPERMSAESYEDFESWVQLQLRKIKRSIQ